MKRLFWLTMAAAVVALSGCSKSGLSSSEPTAFDLMKEGNKYVGEQSKDKVVQARAEKSIGTLTPNAWRIVYYDPTATMKAVEVRFVAGKMMAVDRPLRLLEPLFGKSEPLDRSKLKIDSDKALKNALNESILQNLKITATAPKLEGSDSGPVWKVRIWAQKLRDPAKDAELGEIILSAETGNTLKVDVEIKRVD